MHACIHQLINLYDNAVRDLGFFGVFRTPAACSQVDNTMPNSISGYLARKSGNLPPILHPKWLRLESATACLSSGGGVGLSSAMAAAAAICGM